MAYLGEIGDHLLALRAVVEQGAKGGGYIFGGEAVLQKLGDDAASSDEIDHGDGQVAFGIEGSGDLWRVLDEAFCQPEGERGDPVDDHERVSNEGGLDGGCTAGDDAGAGVVEGFAGVGNEGNAGRIWPCQLFTGLSLHLFKQRCADCRSYGNQVFIAISKKDGSLHHPEEVCSEFTAAATGKQCNPWLCWVDRIANALHGFVEGPSGKRT